MTGAAAAWRVLVVEDDPEDARTTFRSLRADGRFDPVHVRSGAEAIEAAAGGAFAACLVDYRLPDMSGIEVVRRLRELGLQAPMMMLSSVQSDTIVERALAAGADEFCVKHLSYGHRLAGDLGRLVASAAPEG